MFLGRSHEFLLRLFGCLCRLLQLLLLDELILDQALNLVWTILCDIRYAFTSRPDEPFECEIIASGNGIVLV